MNHFIPNELSSYVADMERGVETIILEQLGELVKRGLIVVERSSPTLVEYRLGEPYKFEIRTGVRLVPKEFEYIKKLEEENEKLKKAIKAIQSIQI